MSNETSGETILRLQNEVETLCTENAVLKEAQRWIPVEERLPESLEDVLVRSFAKGRTRVTYQKNGHWGDEPRLADLRDTWQPLPPPPKGGEI